LREFVVEYLAARNAKDVHRLKSLLHPDEVLAELMAEHIALKKSLGEL
jgi:hypothetical protein